MKQRFMDALFQNSLKLLIDNFHKVYLGILRLDIPFAEVLLTFLQAIQEYLSQNPGAIGWGSDIKYKL